MDTVKPFLKYLQKFGQISEAEFNQWIRPYIKIRKFEKRDLITKAGDVENYFNFILQGLVRKFYLKGREEINTQISLENHIIHSQESFHSRTPSEYTIEALEPAVLLSISYDDLEKLISANQRMEHLGRKVITFTLVLKDKWQMQLVKMDPRERFLKFVSHNPELMQRVPQKYLASFLNIKPETFSRYKHLIKEYSKSPN
ncbi:MAG: Crp/Fnr family transcriptional regulator [Chitinophagaceae bacterium]